MFIWVILFPTVHDDSCVRYFFIGYFSLGITSVQYKYHDLSVTLYLTLAQYFIKNENQHNIIDRV